MLQIGGFTLILLSYSSEMIGKDPPGLWMFGLQSNYGLQNLNGLFAALECTEGFGVFEVYCRPPRVRIRQRSQ